ncbi:MAG TPA: hypothetical protein VG755_01035 [Nannocystaceae bacterium]|nr:hypothetical protein [Nannocystaceae bacterium]
MSTHPRRKRRGFSAQLAFWVWVPLALAIGTTLMATHWRTLPMPAADDARLLAALAELRNDDDRERWLVVHVLYAACRCSRRVIDHLVDGPRPAGLAERILLIGATPELDAKLADTPIPVVRVQPEELAERFAIEAAPLLLVVDPAGALRYRGGYSERKQSEALHDVAIIEGLRGDAEVSALPLFGCAVSDQLRRVLDPLGLRRAASPLESSP